MSNGECYECGALGEVTDEGLCYSCHEWGIIGYCEECGDYFDYLDNDDLDVFVCKECSANIKELNGMMEAFFNTFDKGER